MRYINPYREPKEVQEVLVWYRVHFVHGPLHNTYRWFPAPLASYFAVPGRHGGILSSQYQLRRVARKESWRAWVTYEYHFPSR